MTAINAFEFEYNTPWGIIVDCCPIVTTPFYNIRQVRIEFTLVMAPVEETPMPYEHIWLQNKHSTKPSSSSAHESPRARTASLMNLTSTSLRRLIQPFSHSWPSSLRSPTPLQDGAKVPHAYSIKNSKILIDNYRRIALMNNMFKLWTALIK
jgi:hypothetical protein